MPATLAALAALFVIDAHGVMPREIDPEAVRAISFPIEPISFPNSDQNLFPRILLM
jgi:hypothetical protein